MKDNLRAVSFMFIYDLMKGGDNIGRLFIMEFADNESSTFDEGMGC